MAERKKYLVDTSVIIAMFRKNEAAKSILDNLSANDTFICDITVLELLAGCRTTERREEILHFLDTFGLLNNSEDISNLSINLMKRYCIQQQNQPLMRLADCIIAAFAIGFKMELLTFNKKDFAFIKGLTIHTASH